MVDRLNVKDMCLETLLIHVSSVILNSRKRWAACLSTIVLNAFDKDTYNLPSFGKMALIFEVY